MTEIRITMLDSDGLLQLKDLDCSPLPKERDSIYILFYRFFKDTCRLAYIDNELVGFILGLIDQTDQSHAYIHYLFVKEEQRGRRIGEMLMNELIQYLSIKKCNKISLMTGNPKNEFFYSRFGFVQDSELNSEHTIDPVYQYTKRVKKMIFYRLDL